MDISYILSTGICLIGLVTRTSYELGKKAGKVDTKSHWVFAGVFTAMLLMLGSWPLMRSKDPYLLDFPEWTQWIGIGLVILGFGTAAWGLVQLRGVENIDHLVTTGLYSKIRHPMYCGFILWILGWAIYYGAPTSLIVAGICISNILYWRKLEEQKLVSQFGEGYQRYRRETWF